MISELDLVVLTHAIGVHGLRKGDIGTVVHCYRDGEGFEVEFVRADGSTVAVLTLDRTEIRPMEGAEILRVRELAPAA